MESNIRKWMRLVEDSANPMRFVELCDALGIPTEDAEAWQNRDGKYPDDFKLWQEQNNREAMQRILERPEVAAISQVAIAFYQVTKGKPKNMLPRASIDEIRAAMSRRIDLFRGGGGIYNSKLTQPWYSFTTNRRRAENIYAKYPTWDNYSTNVHDLSPNERHWVVKASVPIMHVLYFNRLNEGEVIVSAADALLAKVIVQT